jgi:uncharacterized protein (TIGR02646 family)
MIQLKKKHAVPVPPILSDAGIAERDALCKAFKKGEKDFPFNDQIYGHAEVKSSLQRIQDGKCCFCEAKILHISYGDVEHYRPKAGWTQSNEKLNKPGYYWLAYDWDNLLLSCQICNQRHKKNFFPLLDSSKRALSHEHDITEESPVLIKPDQEDPGQFIAFKEEIPFPIAEEQRGRSTIETLGLDRETLNESRRTKLGPVRILYNLARDIPVTTPEIKKKAVEEIKKIAIEYTADNAEYAAMFRAFFKKNPIDPE